MSSNVWKDFLLLRREGGRLIVWAGAPNECAMREHGEMALANGISNVLVDPDGQVLLAEDRSRDVMAQEVLDAA